MLNKDPLGGLTGPEFCRFRNSVLSYGHGTLYVTNLLCIYLISTSQPEGMKGGFDDSA